MRTYFPNDLYPHALGSIWAPCLPFPPAPSQGSQCLPPTQAQEPLRMGARLGGPPAPLGMAVLGSKGEINEPVKE